ncbi:hypothetical protein IWX90DRAFT_437766 [Phyllosticta citrichinensis]|uniref:Uncharacterized protein n=1 Tax=Phyllosticta citrichinensis TaxID=1130410 RepID=A0ABR1XMK4_9PEZI
MHACIATQPANQKQRVPIIRLGTGCCLFCFHVIVAVIVVEATVGLFAAGAAGAALAGGAAGARVVGRHV